MFVNKVSLNYYQNYQSQISKSQNVAFTGNDKVDEYIGQIKNGTFPDKDDLLSAMHGRMNYRSDAVESVVPVLLDSAEKSAKEIRDLNLQLEQVNQDLEEEKRKVQAANEEIKNTRNICDARLRTKDEQLAAKDAELNEMRAFVAKYKPMCLVKSIEDLDTVLREEAMQVFKDMVENRSKAVESLVKFLMTGEGKEEFIAQMNRNAIILKAQNDGLISDPEFEKEKKRALEAGTCAGNHQVYFIRNMIDDALKASKEGANLINNSVRKQVKENAMALFSLVAEKNEHSSLGLEECERVLADKLDKIADYHNKLIIGRESYIKEFEQSGVKYEEVYTPGRPFETGYMVTEKNNYKHLIPLDFIYSRGKNNNWK